MSLKDIKMKSLKDKIEAVVEVVAPRQSKVKKPSNKKK